MSTRALLFIDPANTGDQRQAWERALFLPLGSEPAITRYCRLIAGRCRPVELIVPRMLAGCLPPDLGDEFRLHTFRNSFDDAAFGGGNLSEHGCETVLLDISRLPAIDINAALEHHRDSGSAMTVFCSCRHGNYCTEQIAWDASGTVQRAVRHYADSVRWSCGGRPVAVVLSRRTFRLDPATPVGSFSELARHVSTRVSRAGDVARCAEHPAVRCHAEPMEALLWLIAASTDGVGRECLGDEGLVPPGVRLHGPICFGKNVSISAGAMVIGPSALGDSCRVGVSAVISRSVILPRQSVPDYGHCHKRVLGPGGELSSEQASALEVIQDSAREQPIPSAPVDVVKRLVDTIVAGAALVLLAPLLGVIALAIRLSSRGPVLFRHRRQGLGGVEFDCLKFRTMVHNADALQSQLRGINEVDGPQFKISKDPRVTRLGRWLRRTNLDELPQLLNVLVGQMSLVGPRPSPDSENQCCPTWRRLRLSVRPGITGLWQVARSCDRRMNGFQEWVYYDTRYVENRGMLLDLMIIWQTIRILAGVGVSTRWHHRWTERAENDSLGHVTAAAARAVH